jgi:hypothetical protein
MDGVAEGALVWNDHNYSLQGESSTAPASTTPPSDQNMTVQDSVTPDPSVCDGEPDPELEQLQYTSSKAPTIQPSTPAAAWILTTMLLLSMLHKTYCANVIGEVAAQLAQRNVGRRHVNKPYSRRMLIFCLTLAGNDVHC